MPKKVVLMANDIPGVEVCQYLVENGDHIVMLYLHEPDRQKFSQEIVNASKCSENEIRLASQLKDPEYVAELRALRPDFIITVYWAHLISEEVINAAVEGTVNFHPALLPINRGWYPHVHSIMNGSPTGVTLHAIDNTADTGPIWAQKEVPLTPYDTAFTIYERLQHEMVRLFKETWPKIVNRELTPVSQDESKAIYHKKSEIKKLDQLNLDDVMKVGDLINLLRARSFGASGFAFFDKNGQRVYVNLRLSPNPTFE